ncbi:hypothetical protein BB14905_14315 [Bacillus sp. B14905]|nr:hypothetical protein BB14905_14315 [Bacillus sp. B14905]
MKNKFKNICIEQKAMKRNSINYFYEQKVTG